MNFNENEYIPRLVDKTLKNYLSVFGAVSVEGPKWCGKTWTSSKFANSVIYLDNKETFEKASLNFDLILNEKAPELIDEWIKIPEIWDKVRRKCDENSKKGKYILTCSTKLMDNMNQRIFHSGAGRIARLKMYPMSLFEANISTKEASLTDMYNGTQISKNVKVPSLEEIATLIVRGGWPNNLTVDKKLISLIPASYLESILSKDINDDKKRDRNKMMMVLRSLARNETTIVSNQTLLKDINDFSTSNETLENRRTLSDYLDVLKRLYIIEDQEAYSNNYRSPNRVGKSVKRHFTDPSLACAVLNLNVDKLMNDLNMFGLMFEALVERDLRIYIEYLGGKLYHFRDNVSGLEVDAIIEFPDGEYGAIEIKLGNNKEKEAIDTLLKFSENMKKKPKFMAIITANSNFVVKDEKTGIYTLPITALKP